MRAVRFELRLELARRWRAWLALGLAIGLIAGLVSAAIAAGRRTDSVVSRYRAYSLATDVIVGNGGTFLDPEHPNAPGVDLARIRRLPQVAAATRGMLVASLLSSHGGRDVTAYVNVEVNPGARGDEAIDRWKLLAGRRAGQDRPDEAVADAGALATLGIGLGDTFRMRLFVGRASHPTQVATVRVVGVRPDLLNNGTSRFVTVSPAFYEAHGGPQLALAAARDAIKVRLRRGSADLAAFQRGAERIAGGRDFQFTVEDQEAEKLQSGFHVQAQALWLAAALGTGALVLLVAQGLARTIELESERHPTLLTLGMSQQQLAALVVGRVSLIATAAAALTLPVAVALSPLAPFGRAGWYEPHPGLAVDPVAPAAGVGLVLVAALPPSVVAAVRARRTRTSARLARGSIGGSAPADVLARAGASPALVGGMRMAVPGAQCATAGTARATMVGAVLAVAVAAAALTVVASLTHLLATPRLFGQTWQFANQQGYGPTARDLARVRTDPAIAAAAFGEDAIVDVGGRSVGVEAYDQIKGAVTPTVVAGRPPTGADELLLGTKTFGALGARLGERIAVRRGTRTVRMTVVGRGILPETSFLSQGEGAAMSFAALKRVVPGAVASRLLVVAAEGPGREAALRRLESYYGTPRAGVPRVVRDVRSVRQVPLVFALLVALVTSATLARALLVSIRRRRREFAILKTLGSTRSQIRAMIAWHATTVGAVAVLVGVPLGLGVGRWLWRAIADQLGVAPATATSTAAVILVAPAVLLLVNLVAAVPARMAARTRPAVVLRAE